MWEFQKFQLYIYIYIYIDVWATVEELKVYCGRFEMEGKKNQELRFNCELIWCQKKKKKKEKSEIICSCNGIGGRWEVNMANSL